MENNAQYIEFDFDSPTSSCYVNGILSEILKLLASLKNVSDSWIQLEIAIVFRAQNGCSVKIARIHEDLSFLFIYVRYSCWYF